MFSRSMWTLPRDPTNPMESATKNYVDTGGGVTDYGVISTGTINPTLIPQQSYTITAATTINTPPTAANGQDITAYVLAQSASYILTIGGSPGINNGYPSSLQIPSGKVARVGWQYLSLVSRFTVIFFSLEK